MDHATVTNGPRPLDEKIALLAKKGNYSPSTRASPASRDLRSKGLVRARMAPCGTSMKIATCSRSPLIDAQRPSDGAYYDPRVKP